MQKKTLCTAAFVAVLALLVSCDSGSNTKTFSNKNDSIAFAKAVMDIYSQPDPNRLVGDTIPAARDTGKGFGPISWQTVEDYSKRYDEDGCLKSPEGVPYQGFSIDTAGYSRLKSTDVIKGLYLRLGRKPDGSFTIMVLGTNGNGSIINKGSGLLAPKDSTNFDNLNTCPELCP